RLVPVQTRVDVGNLQRRPATRDDLRAGCVTGQLPLTSGSCTGDPCSLTRLSQAKERRHQASAAAPEPASSLWLVRRPIPDEHRGPATEEACGKAVDDARGG